MTSDKPAACQGLKGVAHQSAADAGIIEYVLDDDDPTRQIQKIQADHLDHRWQRVRQGMHEQDAHT